MSHKKEIEVYMQNESHCEPLRAFRIPLVFCIPLVFHFRIPLGGLPNGTWLGMLYKHLSNSRLSLVEGRGMPTLREGGKFLVDLVEADEVELVREGCRAAGVWRVTELRSLDGTRLREAVEPNGALERLVGRGKAGGLWGKVVRRVAQARGYRDDVIGRAVRTGAGSRCNRPLSAWERSA